MKTLDKSLEVIIKLIKETTTAILKLLRGEIPGNSHKNYHFLKFMLFTTDFQLSRVNV